MDASCVKEKPEGEAAVRTGEAEPGPAEAAPGERSAVENRRHVKFTTSISLKNGARWNR